MNSHRKSASASGNGSAKPSGHSTHTESHAHAHTRAHAHTHGHGHGHGYSHDHHAVRGSVNQLMDKSVLEPMMYGNQVQFEDTSIIYPLTRRDSAYSNGSAFSFLCTGTDKFPDIEVSDFSYGVPPILPSSASSVTYSPPSLTASRTSSVGSAWSPIQTDFASDVCPVGVSRSRGPSPLRNAAKAPGDVRDGYVCEVPKCDAKFSRREHLEIHAETAHSHICLWGDNGPCDSAGFATREELNWHVKSEHLLECPVMGCAESTFGNRDFLDCHVRWAHGVGKEDDKAACQSSNLLDAVAHCAPPKSTAMTVPQSEKPVVSGAARAEDRILKMEMSIGISKKRCRDQMRTVVEKKLKRSAGNTPRAGESPGTLRSRTPRLLETASFPVVWEHGVLPFLIEFMPKWCGPGHVVSVTRGRKPNTRRICIMTRANVSKARRLVIAGHVRDLLPENYHSTITFVFSTGEVDRLVWSRGLTKDMPDEVCLPRNPFAYINPCMGDSIGATLEDGEEITATLGPCVTVGGGTYWLASFHPFVNAAQGAPVTVEHPSPADRARCSDERHDALDAFSPRVGSLTATSGFDLNTTRVSHDPYWEECAKEPPLVVTDWVLISANTRQANLLRKFPSTTQRRETPVTSMSSVVPGAAVGSTGRTSGYQLGQVCEIPAYVDGSKLGNGTGKASREWFVEEPYSCENEDEWIRGGIGVEGDSGAAIVDSETNALLGQLWGRNKYFGAGPRLTYFTPIFDIFDDIQERCGQQSRPQLPQYRDDADRWPAYPLCRQCFDLREYLESRRSSRESLMSMIGMQDERNGDNDNDLTSVSELATPKDHHSYLIRHTGPDDTSSSFGTVVSPAPIHALFAVPQAASPSVADLRSPYAQALSEEDLYESRCPDTHDVGLGKRPAIPVSMVRSGSQQSGKRRRIM